VQVENKKKINHERDVHCAFILGKLAQVQSLQRTLKALRRKGIMSSSYNDTKKLFQGRNRSIAIEKGTPAV
jgi:hypothetical protein